MKPVGTLIAGGREYFLLSTKPDTVIPNIGPVFRCFEKSGPKFDEHQDHQITLVITTIGDAIIQEEGEPEWEEDEIFQDQEELSAFMM